MSKARTLNPYDMEERINRLEENGGVSADEAKRSDIATEFSATKNYTAGTFVYYQGKLYIFNVDHTAGAWDAADVSVVNVTDEVTSNKAAIDAVDDRVDAVSATMVKGYHTDSSGAKEITLDNLYQQLFISVSTGLVRTVYLISQKKNDATVAETIYSTPNQTPVDLSVTNTGNTSFVITIPQFAQTNIMSTEGFTVSDYTP